MLWIEKIYKVLFFVVLQKTTSINLSSQHFWFTAYRTIVCDVNLKMKEQKPVVYSNGADTNQRNSYRPKHAIIDQ